MNKKAILFVVLLTIMPFALKAQNVTIPDLEFKSKLLNHTPVIDTNGDGEIPRHRLANHIHQHSLSRE